MTEEQVANFAGNSIMLQGKSSPILVMSTRAYNHMSETQLKTLS